LKRLGLAERIRSHFSTDDMLPAAGQGALGIEVRADDSALQAALEPLVHRPAWLATQAERAVSRGLGGSCSVPLAAHAQWLSGATLSLHAALGHAAEPQQPLITAHAQGHVVDDAQALELGAQVVKQLQHAGAAAYLSTSGEAHHG
jgi:hydroxymethylbilane synthase